MYLIAECGVNHGGNLERALRMVEVAKDCGADCAKFQHFYADELGQPELQRFELGLKALKAVKDHAAEVGIDFLCTPFSVRTVHELYAIGCDRMKLSHRYQPEVWAEVAKLPVSTIASADGYEHAQRVMAVLPASTLLFVHDRYPMHEGGVIFCMMDAFRNLAEHVGFSDHTKGAWAAKFAVERGAEVIEKHFALDDTAFEWDWSADPDTLREIAALR